MGNPHTSSEKDGMRINKYISHAGVCSRRDADKLVEQGRVRLNGEVVTEHGTRVYPGQTVEVDGDRISLKDFDYILLNKPKDTISTTDDPKGRKTVLEAAGISSDNPKGMFPVGRLDRNTTGVLLLTNDGDLAHRLMHPSYEIAKIYFVRTREPVKPHELDELQSGVELEDGLAAADRVTYIDQRLNKTDVALEIHEGRNRQVRRMFEKLGHDIVQLDRPKYAGLTAGKLDRGRWRRLRPHEVRSLRKRVNLK
ncbi:RNA-binding protein [Longibacter salinarum]|uniref:Pseudouridine synthase n=1 Tax=Longibacter salinarum TaxID=1850348 RepID=A0A2A8D283_9BACT|nr:pseudouridine synthase [Longibacter salinarum]PEN15082.1 RNA-binding protein [Longibacter salinarum]